MKTDLSYCSHVLLGENDKSLWQNIYSSQSYQSFYSVFSNFTSQDSGNGKRSLDKMELEIFNYKGLLDMAFYRNEKETKDPYWKGYSLEPREFTKGDSSESNKYIELVLYVCAKAVHPKSEKKIPILKSDLETIGDICQGKLLFVRRQLLSFGGEKSEDVSVQAAGGIDNYNTNFHLNQGLFDNEFFYRNGVLVRQRQDTDSSLINPKVSKEGTFDAGLFDGNPSCHNSALYFQFKEA